MVLRFLQMMVYIAYLQHFHQVKKQQISLLKKLYIVSGGNYYIGNTSENLYTFDEDTNTFSSVANFSSIYACVNGLPQCFSNDSNYLDFVESDVSVGFSYENNRYYYNNNYSVASSDKVLSGYTILNQAGQQLTGTMPNNGDVTITPTTSKQTKEKGYYNSLKVNPVTSAIDSNITPENIKSGVNILGVEGTLEGGIDTSDATATADDILNGKTAYVNGEKITGSLPLFPNTRTFTAEGGVTNDTENSKLRLTTINTLKQTLDSNLNMEFNAEYSDIAIAIGLTADKIKAGETILGITGTYTGETDVSL